MCVGVCGCVWVCVCVCVCACGLLWGISLRFNSLLLDDNSLHCWPLPLASDIFQRIRRARQSEKSRALVTKKSGWRPLSSHAS